MNVPERGDLGAESRRWVELVCLVPGGHSGEGEDRLGVAAGVAYRRPVTEEAAYQPLPTPHRRAGTAPPSSLQIQQGSLPPDLARQARARHADAEVLLLPRAAEASHYDDDPAAAIYGSSHRSVGVLRALM
jgi:hypothetical protein